MKRIKHLLIVCCLLGLGALSLNAQDIHFSQFYLSPLNLNPAMTGVMNCNVRLVANYRNQWASVLNSNAYNTYSVSYDQRIPVGRYDFFGIGGTFWGDKAGELDFGTLQARLSFAYSKKMGGYRSKAHYLVFGADAGVSQRSIDFLNAQYGNQNRDGVFDGSMASGEAFENTNFLFADVSAGLLWFTVFDEDNNLYLGGAYSHLTNANQSFSDSAFVALYSKFTAHAGGEFMMTSKVGLVPGVIALVQGPSFELNTGASLKFLLGGNKRQYQAFQVGAWMRLSNHFTKTTTADAFILSTRFDYNDFSLGFSYDINVSSLRPASNANGAFEFALVYKICGPQKRNVYCPNF
ncbi:MAG: type IX secretion system PorP/SprF family membrane protein [Saprospiraceae bacterium]|jgi:type IX secretion system PorP/SprF family membrane protein